MLQEAKTVPEKDLRTQRFFGKRRSCRAGRAFCPAKRRHAKACSQQGSQKVSQNFLGKGATGIRAKSLLQCKLLRILPPLQGSRKRFANAKIFWEKEEPSRKPCVLPCKTPARKGVLSTGLPKSIAELFGKRSNRHSSKEFAAMQTLADFAAPSGFPKKICECKDFLGKGGAAAQAVRFALQNAGTQRRAPTWLRRQDSNLRPSGYEPDELPNCSTPRYRHPFRRDAI